jgi:hypothetical protein
MLLRMMLPMSVLSGAGSLGCALNLDLDRFEFSGPDNSIGGDSSLPPEVDGDRREEPLVPCPTGARECLDGGAPVLDHREEAGINTGSRGNEDGNGDGGDDGMLPGLTDAGGLRSCDRCTVDENCALGVCQSAAASCAALKAFDPSLADGIYSIASDGLARRTYCDMTAQVALCSDEPSDHEGVARDSSHLPFVLSSVLEGSACRVWNVRARQDGHPLDALATSSDGMTVRPCTPLGFSSDPVGYDRNSGCRYGQNESYGTCGFNTTRPLLKWANLCTCELENDMGAGFFDNEYVLQGTIFASVIPWDATGDVSVLCGT